MKPSAILVAASAFVALTSCSGAADVKTAEVGVERFHKQYNAGQLREIYLTSAAEMKQATTEPDFMKFMSAVRGKLGGHTGGKTVGWHVNFGSAGKLVTLNRQASFERGDGIEQFVFRIDDSRPKLVSYHINSNALVTN